MKAHAISALRIQASQVALEAQQSLHEGSIVQQLQEVIIQERMKNRAIIKSFIRCTHFLACQHIPHTTNFDKLVDLVVSCGGEDMYEVLPGEHRKECKVHTSRSCSGVCRSSSCVG